MFMLKKLIISIFISLLFAQWVAFAEDEDEFNYTTLTTVDLNTFNEYRYRMTEEFFELRSYYEIYWSISETSASSLLDIATTWYNYLPDSLYNENLYNKLKTAIERAIRYPNNSSNYEEIISELSSYIDDVNITKIKWSIDSYPSKWNAPLTVTFRANVTDPSWTVIPTYNYTWWMDVWWKKHILSQTSWPSFAYTFEEEWNFTIFLDVWSNHKNVGWYTDVLPFRSSETIEIDEKIASIILDVNDSRLWTKTELKFTPEEASYWLLFDATSSTPTWWAKFTSTEWDFGNWIERENSWEPNIERVVYSKEWEFDVTLKLKTNEGNTVEKEFTIIIHDPIATIKANSESWYLWDKFTFSAEGWNNDDDLTYEWEIININTDDEIFSKNWSLFTYIFQEKWEYSVRLKVTEAFSNEPDVDTMVVYINSQAPIVDFTSTIPYPSKPNMVLLDATKTYDPDYTDEWNLEYNWIIDWEIVELTDPNYNWSIGYYTFDSIWNHNVVLEVTDPDDITVNKQKQVDIDSILSVHFNAYSRVSTINQNIRFVANSPEARVYYWDFWDGSKSSLEEPTHQYSKSWIYTVKLKVIDKNDEENSFSKDIYIWDADYPLAFVEVSNGSNREILYREWECEWNWAYIIDRVNSVKFLWEESINVDWSEQGISYSWKFENNKYYTTKNVDKKFDELWCFSVKLTVKSDDNWRSHTETVWVKVENIEPTLSSIDLSVADEDSDPIIVTVKALWAEDEDWVIQNYLWYYYTDLDSEPQDFRSTISNSTTFVLSKIAWKYYFVVVMKDNNEARVNSEELTWSKYFISLTWDSWNTPLIKLMADNTSISVWDEVTFNVQVENVLGNDISNSVEYSWDLDSDGFYDIETEGPTYSHVFNESWEHSVKVKVKNKWYSSTKTLTISVANILQPNLSYISIWNKFVFLNNSKWSYKTLEWNLWDWTVVKDKESFVHEYEDEQPSHIVKITLKEWTKTKSNSLKVIKNVKNFITSKREDFIYFTNVDIVDDVLTLEEENRIYIYLWDSKWAEYYWIDEDLNYDSNLNWGKDDDIDNKTDDSYINGAPILVELNDSREQWVRVFILDENEEVIESYDFKIIKEYIEESEIDPDTIVFSWVSDSEKLKIEKLKNYISNFESQYKYKSLLYVQTLQEEWFDTREKTNIILEFENYINEINVAYSDDIINLLESLLVEWEEDKSEKAIMLTALKNLIIWIDCWDVIILEEWQTCYDNLVLKLEEINESSNIENNKALWTEILKVVEVTDIMTNDDKIDFKAILKTFVYWWVDNIPEEEATDEPIDPTPVDDGTNVFFWLLSKIFFVLLIIIWVITFSIILFYLWYKISNKDSNVWFQDFIIDKTSHSNKVKKEKKESKIEVDDILNEVKQFEKEDKVTKIEKKETEKVKEIKQEEVKTIKNEKIEKKQEVNSENVPDWLKWSFSWETEQEKKKENLDKKKEEDLNKSSQEENIPDWLKWSISEDVKVKEEKNKEKTKEEKVKSEQKEEKTWIDKSKAIDYKDLSEEKLPTNEQLEDFTKIKEDSNQLSKEDNIPDWLKWSFSEETKIEENKIKEKEVKKEDIKTEKVKTEEKITQKQNIEKKNEDKLTWWKPKTTNIKKAKTKKANIDKKVEKTQEKEEKEKTEKTSTQKEKTEEGLWDDWMKIPDWLKSESDDEEKDK